MKLASRRLWLLGLIGLLLPAPFWAHSQTKPTAPSIAVYASPT